MRVHSGSLLWLCIRLHDTNTKCHAGASHTGASSPRFLCRSEIFIPARKFIPVSCKRDMTVLFISIKVSSILLHYKTRTPANTALCKHGATFHLAPGMKVAPLSYKHPLTVRCICYDWGKFLKKFISFARKALPKFATEPTFHEIYSIDS